MIVFVQHACVSGILITDWNFASIPSHRITPSAQHTIPKANVVTARTGTFTVHQSVGEKIFCANYSCPSRNTDNQFKPDSAMRKKKSSTCPTRENNVVDTTGGTKTPKLWSELFGQIFLWGLGHIDPDGESTYPSVSVQVESVERSAFIRATSASAENKSLGDCLSNTQADQQWFAEIFTLHAHNWRPMYYIIGLLTSLRIYELENLPGWIFS